MNTRYSVILAALVGFGCVETPKARYENLEIAQFYSTCKDLAALALTAPTAKTASTETANQECESALFPSSQEPFHQLTIGHVRTVEVVDADVTTVTAATDKVLLVRANDGDRIQYLDFQSGPDAYCADKAAVGCGIRPGDGRGIVDGDEGIARSALRGGIR